MSQRTSIRSGYRAASEPLQRNLYVPSSDWLHPQRAQVSVTSAGDLHLGTERAPAWRTWRHAPVHADGDPRDIQTLRTATDSLATPFLHMQQAEGGASEATTPHQAKITTLWAESPILYLRVLAEVVTEATTKLGDPIAMQQWRHTVNVVDASGENHPLEFRANPLLAKIGAAILTFLMPHGHMHNNHGNGIAWHVGSEIPQVTPSHPLHPMDAAEMDMALRLVDWELGCRQLRASTPIVNLDDPADKVMHKRWNTQPTETLHLSLNFFRLPTIAGWPCSPTQIRP
ncbi:MAG: hypothetical protein HYV02_07410 [Deltaproteobacteria bacterium]|nr:hypothetical protein [Deltaproteobacteria bacterium]